MKCEVPGCDREHMWMKDSKLVCSVHYYPPNEIKWVDEVQKAKIPDAPLLDQRDFEPEEDYNKLWKGIEPCIDPDSITDEKIKKFMSEISLPESKDITPEISKLNIHKGNESILDDWSDPELRISEIWDALTDSNERKPFNWPSKAEPWEPEPFKSRHWSNELRGMERCKPEGKLQINEKELEETLERIKRFTQGFGRLELIYSATGITSKVGEPDINGVCETFYSEENKWCSDPALRREDCYNHYFCEKCYQNYLNKEYPKIEKDETETI